MIACRDDKKIGLTRAVKAAEVLHAGCVRKRRTGEHVDVSSKHELLRRRKKLRDGKRKKRKEGKVGLVEKLNTRQLTRGTTRIWPSSCCFPITDGRDVAADRIRVRPQMQPAKTICGATPRPAFQSRGGPSGVQLVGKARRRPARLGQSRLDIATGHRRG